MKSVTGYLVGAVVLALAGWMALTLGTFDRRMARAQETFAARNYSDSQSAFETPERYFEWAGLIPGIGHGLVNDVRARQAALHYWRREYRSIVPQETDPFQNVPADNLGLQVVLANAVYRSGQAQWKNRQTAVQALNAAIAADFSVLKNSVRQEDAAYNYEYLIRLRDDVAKGRRQPAPQQPVTGEGAPVSDPSKNDGDLKIYVPLEQKERGTGSRSDEGNKIKRRG